MTARTRAVAVPLLTVLLLAACMTRPPAPVTEVAPLSPGAAAPPPAPAPPARERDWRPPTYTVKAGDTLAQIALNHGLDYRDLAAWNNIENPNVIRVGQVLVVAAPGHPGTAPATAAGSALTSPLITAAPVAPKAAEPTPSLGSPVAPTGRGNTATFKAEPKAVKLPYSDQALAQLQAQLPAASAPVVQSPATPAPAAAAAIATQAPTPKPDAARVPELDDDNLGWVWPTAGKVVAGFSETANLKGIDIAGKAGQPVLASAGGKVVYAGTGLRGYGKLIIVKHNSTYLSAYAHNRDIMVKEGQQVSKGQKISEMGDTDADQVKLHFEIRRLGKPVDPTKYLPPA
jgi:lipoprotein NlpD